MRWTVFEASPHANETSCASDCWYRSDCLTHFLGHGGCFLAVNNHTHEESRDMDDSVIGPAAAGNRHFSGTLTGCKLKEDKLQEARPSLEMGHDWARPFWKIVQNSAVSTRWEKYLARLKSNHGNMAHHQRRDTSKITRCLRSLTGGSLQYRLCTELVATFWANAARLAEQGNPTQPHSDPRCRRAEACSPGGPPVLKVRLNSF